MERSREEGETYFWWLVEVVVPLSSGEAGVVAAELSLDESNMDWTWLFERIRIVPALSLAKGKTSFSPQLLILCGRQKKQIFVSKNGVENIFFTNFFTCESEAVLPPFWDNLRGCCKFIFGSKSDKGFCCCCCCSRVLAIIFATGLCLVGMVKPLPNLGKVPPLAVRLLAECWCIKMRRSGFLLDNAISTSS